MQRYYIFLIQKEIRLFDKDYRYYHISDLVDFIQLNKEEEILPFLANDNSENRSPYYFIVHGNIRLKTRRMSVYRYFSYSSIYENILEFISLLENVTIWDFDRLFIEKGVTLLDRQFIKTNVYVNGKPKTDVDKEKYNVIETDKNINECYFEEMKCDHHYDESYFYYIDQDKIYKKDILEPISWTEEIDSNLE